jgi:hypothetical protein
VCHAGRRHPIHGSGAPTIGGLCERPAPPSVARTLRCCQKKREAHETRPDNGPPMWNMSISISVMGAFGVQVARPDLIARGSHWQSAWSPGSPPCIAIEVVDPARLAVSRNADCGGARGLPSLSDWK